MIDLLLDTHVFVWYTANDPRIDDATRQLLEDSASSVYLSVVSGWEISIKLGLGKLYLAMAIQDLLDVRAHGIQLLDIAPRDIVAYSQLSFPAKDHRDPFDRMLAVQAREHDLLLVSADPVFKHYLSKNLHFIG